MGTTKPDPYIAELENDITKLAHALEEMIVVCEPVEEICSKNTDVTSLDGIPVTRFLKAIERARKLVDECN